MSANTSPLSVAVASSTVDRPRPVSLTSVVRPSVGCGSPFDQTVALQTPDRVRDAGDVDLQPVGGLRDRQRTTAAERQQSQQFVPREAEVVRTQGRLDAGQQDLVGAHHRRDGDHAVGHLTPTGALPVGARQRDGIALGGFGGHASSYRTHRPTRVNLGRRRPRPTADARAAPFRNPRKPVVRRRFGPSASGCCRSAARWRRTDRATSPPGCGCRRDRPPPCRGCSAVAFPPPDQSPYVHAMSMRVPQAKLLNATVALNDVGATLFISSCAAADDVAPCSQPHGSRAAPRSPGRRPPARRRSRTAADVSHRDRRRRQRTLSSTDWQHLGPQRRRLGLLARPAR